jgi:serine/threonine protein kinase
MNTIRDVMTDLTKYSHEELENLSRYYGLTWRPDIIFILAINNIRQSLSSDLSVEFAIFPDKDLRIDIDDIECLKNTEYDMNRYISKGTFGTVYKATNKRTKQPLVFKIQMVTDKFAKEEFLKENEVNKLLNDVNVGPVLYDFWICNVPQPITHKGWPISQKVDIGVSVQDFYNSDLFRFFMHNNYIDNNLVYDSRIEEKTPKLIIHPYLKPSQKQTAIAVTETIVDQVKKMHTQGYIHCDLKPENILIDEYYGVVKRVAIADFGISMALNKVNLDELMQYYVYFFKGYYPIFNQDIVEEAFKTFSFSKSILKSAINKYSKELTQYQLHFLDSLPEIPIFDISKYPEYFDYIFLYILVKQYITTNRIDVVNILIE